MSILTNLIWAAILIPLCLWSYHQQALWFRLLTHVLLSLGKGRGFFKQWLIYAPIFVSWLLLCRWLDVKAWHGLAASLIAFAMLVALQAMRSLEEQQKRQREENP